MAKGHLASEFVDQGDELSMVLRPIPAESPHLKGRVEKAIDFFKDMFVKLNAQFQFNQRNDPQEWCAAFSFACNNHIRRNGFTPYQYVIGKSPRIPTSLVEVMEGDDRRLSANSAALSKMDHDEQSRFVQLQTVLSLSWTPMTLCAELLLAECDHPADLFFLDSLCIIGEILTRRLSPRG